MAKEWFQQHLPHRATAEPASRHLKATKKNQDQGLNEQQVISMWGRMVLAYGYPFYSITL